MAKEAQQPPAPLCTATGCSRVVQAARTVKPAELNFLSCGSPPHPTHSSIILIFVFTSCFCNSFTTDPACAWPRRGAFTAITGSPHTSQTCVCSQHTKGRSFDLTDPTVYLNQCQCWCQGSYFMWSGLIQSRSRRGGPVEGWPLVCPNQPASAWGHQNLPREHDKRGRLEGKAHGSDDRLVMTCKHPLTLAA